MYVPIWPITEDPIKDGLNWYAYCGNNPVNRIDPWGLATKLRSLVEQTTGNITWNNDTKTATVTIDNITQKYCVVNEQVFVGSNKVGYIENDSIMVEESDFNKDFKIVGILTIYSYFDSHNPDAISSGDGLGGHSFIGYETFDGNSVMVSTRYQTFIGGSFMASTWNGGEKTVLNRKEDFRLKNDSNTSFYSKNLTANQENKLINSIKNENPKWSIKNPCTIYAINVFYDATGLSALPVEQRTGGFSPIPSALKRAIEYDCFY